MKFSRIKICVQCGFIATTLFVGQKTVHAQVFGVELHNNLMPASGGMGGVSIARPQDLTSGLNGNPSTLTQFRGTQFTFSGGWAEATFNMTQTGAIPPLGQSIIEPFSAKSQAQGSAVGNIGITQDISEFGLPVTLGVGFVTTSGLAVDFRDVPESNGSNASLAIFSLPMSLGVDLTERWSVGVSTALGIGFLDGPFVGAGGMTLDYALRGTLGTNYMLNDCNTIGAYYQTKQSFTFNNAFTLNPGPTQISQDVAMDLPENLGLGFANSALLEGRLLLGVDLIYKLWNNADLFKSIYDNQLAVQLGSQYSVGKYRFRTGYTWAENPIDRSPGSDIGGVIQPGGLRAVNYTQGLFAVTSQHRISAGIGKVDILPGIDMDMMAGGMFRDTEHLGAFTTTSIESYWIGAGLTWRFNRGSCERSKSPNQWSSPKVVASNPEN